MSDLDNIIQIEKELKVKLKERDSSIWGIPSYTLNQSRQVTALSLYECKIKNLNRIISALQDLRNLTELWLNENKLSDICLLKYLHNLTRLWLNGNRIHDISPLIDLSNLMELNLVNTQLRDISPLKDLRNLTCLRLNKNKLYDISSLKDLQKLTFLDLGGNQLRDISPLKDLRNLTLLDLQDNQLSDISPLKDLHNLEHLRLKGNQLSDISPLKDLHKLTVLVLGYNQISDISPLKDLQKLYRLNLQNNPLIELPPWITNFSMEFQWKDSDSIWDDYYITFYENPIKSPPLEIVWQGKDAVRNYFESLARRKINSREISMAKATKKGEKIHNIRKLSLEGKIFLSYAREDKEKVEELYEKLSNAGYDPWMDIKNILPGEDWKRTLIKAIRNSHIFLACLSENSVNKRGIIQEEIREALEMWKQKLEDDIYFIPVILENCNVPDSLSKFQWVDLSSSTGFDKLLKSINTGLERLNI